MIAVFVNMGTVLLGSLIGILFRSRLRESVQKALMTALGLCTAVIGIKSALAADDILCVIICMALGTALGEWLRIDDAIERAGDFLKKRFVGGRADTGRFTEGFVSACILFCIGSMTIVGSLEAGLRQDYSIIFAKSTLDFVSSMAMAAAMGFGVPFAVLFILVFQGGLTLLAGLAGPALSAAAVNGMSAVGGTILIGTAVMLMDLSRERIRLANMLPAIFLPIIYIPLARWIGGLF